MESMRGGALARLRAGLMSYSDSERIVADWILEQPRALISMSMSDVARACGVSDTTVLRLSRRAGFRGYTDLKLALALDVVRPGELIHGAVADDDDTATVLGKVMNATAQALRDTQAVAQPRVIDAVIDAIESAARIVIVGVGSSGVLGQTFYQRLARLGRMADAPLDGQVQLMHAAALGRGDLLVAISYSGATKDVIDSAERARARGATVVAITGNSSSPLALVSDHVLVSVSTQPHSDPLSAMVTSLALLDVLLVAFALRHPEIAEETERVFLDAIVPKSM